MPKLRRLREALFVVLALSLYWLMAISVSSRHGVTADEVVHLTGGYSYWKFNDYRLHPENGTLPMRVAALPVLGLDLKFPSTDDPLWLGSKVNLVGEQFFHRLGNPTAEMLWRGRAAMALFGVLAVWLTWRWARGLFGRAAGALALVLAVFCPALLAHGGLITSDIAFTACSLAALSAVWRLLHRGTWGRLLAASVACAACFLSKMSGAFIVPVIGLLLLLRWMRPVPYALAFGRRVRLLRGRLRVAGATLALLVATGAGSLVLLWANYSFRFEGANLARSDFESYYFPWDVVLDEVPVPWSDESSLTPMAPKTRAPEPTTLTQLIGTLRDHRLLPEAFLWGFAHTYKFSRERPSFFMGEHRKTGWPLFFPTAFLMKTPLPALVLFVAGIAALLVMRRRGPSVSAWLRPRGALLYRAAPLLLFAALYWFMAVRMTLNLGHRHILPVYPAFYVFASAAVLWLTVRVGRLVAVALVAAAGLQAVDSLTARPFYLAYFQPLTGGTERAHRYFVDSSLDWGQGLPDLRVWLEELRRGGDTNPVYLTYFGADSPQAYGLDVVRFGDEMTDYGERFFPAQVRGGWFVMSATHYRRVYLPTRNGWTAEHEALYRRLMQRLNEAGGSDGTDAARHAQLQRDAQDIELLQFARLCRWLDAQGREPTAMIGASLLVFPLTDAEVGAALYGPVPFQPMPVMR